MNTRLGRFFIVVVTLVAGAAAMADEPPQYEMTTYQLVLLKTVPGTERVGEREAVHLQEGHLAQLEALYERGEALLSGPLSGAAEGFREAIVLNVGSLEKAAAIMEQNPWVQAGRLTTHLHTWWAAKGILQPPEHLLHGERCVLGLIQRPDGAPDFPDEKLAELQAGHMKNIKAMAASGDLVIAGPMGEDGPLRGIFIFRTTDTARLAEMVARDPSVKAGRLGVELIPWRVPKGIVPQD
jgi:uncharacterized protein YciI